MMFAVGVDVNSPEYKLGFLLGSLFAGALCGLWPLCTGLSKGRPIMGIIGFFSCIPCGFLFGCLLALPVAFLFKTLISVLPPPAPSVDDDFPDPPFNPHANGRRSAF